MESLKAKTSGIGKSLNVLGGMLLASVGLTLGCAAPEEPQPEERASTTAAVIGPNCHVDQERSGVTTRSVWDGKRSWKGTQNYWTISGTGDCSSAMEDCYAWLQRKGANEKMHFEDWGDGKAYCFGWVPGTFVLSGSQ